MRRLALALPTFLVIFTSVIQIGAKEWRGIKPLHSTRTDVERLMGQSAHASGSWLVYQTEREAISILFASGPPCGSNAESEWRVPKGTVVSITISPKSQVLLSTLNLDESRYQKLQDPHRLNRIEYRNKEEGESISVVGDEISTFTYFAAAKDLFLHCSSSTPREPDMARRYYFRLDAYGDLPFRHEKLRLDNFSIALQQRPGCTGYVIGYPASRVSLSNTVARLNRARNYLVNVRGIEAKRLRQIRGGFRKEFAVELFIVPPEAEAPSPQPPASAHNN